MSLPPSLPPNTAATRTTGAAITALILAWLIWLVLVMSYSTDLLIMWFGQRPLDKASPEPPLDFAVVLGVVSGFQLGVIFLVRRFFLHFLVQPRRLLAGTWPAAIVTLTGLGIIYALIKAIELYGLILWFGSSSWSSYLPFAIPSFLLTLAHMPCFLLTRRVIQHRLPSP